MIYKLVNVLAILLPEQAEKNYIKAAVGGIMKVMSKMGISTVRSYHGAQIFEALGLNTNFINKFFVNTPTRIGGIGLGGVAHEALARYERAFKSDETVLEPGGWYGPVKMGKSICSTLRQSIFTRIPYQWRLR